MVAAVVHRADAVGVAIEGDAQVGPGLAHLGDQRLQILRHRRVGMVIGKAAVHLEDTFRWRPRSGFPVCGASPDRPCRCPRRRPRGCGAGTGTARRPPPRTASPRRPSSPLPSPLSRSPVVDHAADLLDRRAVNRGSAAHRLEAVELARIVAARDHHGAIGLQVEDRIVEHRGGHHAQIDDIAAARLQPAHQRVAQARRAQAGIATQADSLALVALHVGAEGVAELLHIRVQQFHIGDAADVVLSKYRGFEHGSFVLNIPWR